MQRWYLHNLSSGKAYLIEGELVIGRTLMTLVNDAWLSREHFRLTVKKDRVFLMDLGSNNGTRLNDQPVQPLRATRLERGDLILAGSQRFKIYPAAVLPGDESVLSTMRSTSLLSDRARGVLPFLAMAIGGLAILWVILVRAERKVGDRLTDKLIQQQFEN